MTEDECIQTENWLEDLYFIPGRPDGKRPRKNWKFGGWPHRGNPEFEDNDAIYAAEEVGNLLRKCDDCPPWLCVGNVQKNLFVIDIDTDKMDKEQVLEITVSDFLKEHLENGFVVTTPSGGFHVYTFLNVDRFDDLDIKQIDNVDLKGHLPGAAGYVVFPFEHTNGYTRQTPIRPPLEVTKDELLESPLFTEEQSDPVEPPEIPDDYDADEALERMFENAPDGDELREMYHSGTSHYPDRSEAEYRFVCRLDQYVTYGDKDLARKILDNSNLSKWNERPDKSYRDSLLEPVGNQEWYYGYSSVQVCEPPDFSGEPVDIETRRQEIQARMPEVLTNDHINVFEDCQGTGKTTNAILGTLEETDDIAVYVDKHRNARDIITNSPIDADFTHIRGASQKRHPCCIDAESENRACDIHGEHGPSMCPVYNQSEGLKNRYEALAEATNHHIAHQIPEVNELHDDGCPYLEQYDNPTGPLLAPHEFLLSEKIRNGNFAIIDESIRLLGASEELTPCDFHQAANVLESVVGAPSDALAGYARDLADATANGSLEDIDAPEICNEKYYHLADCLAKLKYRYNETLKERIISGDYNGEPFCFDAILATLLETSDLDSEEIRRAIGCPVLPEQHCPVCRSQTYQSDGVIRCSECEWNEIFNEPARNITERAPTARAKAWIGDDVLKFKKLPSPDSLPDSAVLLDSTPVYEKIAALFGVPVDDIETWGDQPVDLRDNMTVTQITNGEYPPTTLSQNSTTRGKIQQNIDRICQKHDRVLIGLTSKLEGYFDYPENAKILHYWAARGLNYDSYDAVICIGSPHPNPEDIYHKSGILAQGQDWDVGGEEFTKRKNNARTRKYLFEDENGRGRQTAVKEYSGLTGTLFKNARERELEQFIHRIRPVKSDDNHVYLFTSVPTSLPVDRLCDLNELTVPAGAYELFEAAKEQGVSGTKRDFYDFACSEGITSQKGSLSRHTIGKWVDALEEHDYLTRYKGSRGFAEYKA